MWTAITTTVTHQIVVACIQLGIIALIKAFGALQCPDPGFETPGTLHRLEALAWLNQQCNVTHCAVCAYLGRELKTGFLCAHMDSGHLGKE